MADQIDVHRYGGERGWWDNDFYLAHWEIDETGWAGDGTLQKIPVIVLPHQCDDWIIGDKDQARKLIADLEKLIKQGPPADG